MGNSGQTGFVYKTERFCIHDGPGIRTLFYFRGCPLDCRWCCNPESRAAGPIRGGDGLLPWREPVGVDELTELAGRDAVYYRSSGGGVTLTGGEVLFQPEFAARLLESLRGRGIHTAIETSGYAARDKLEMVLAHVDLVLLDIKHMDSARHSELTGHGNERILANARLVHEREIPLIIRLPLVPGCNDDAANLHAVGAFVHDDLPDVTTVCVLGYHNYAVNKYRTMGLEYPMGELPPASEAQITRAAEILRHYVPSVMIGG